MPLAISPLASRFPMSAPFLRGQKPDHALTASQPNKDKAGLANCNTSRPTNMAHQRRSLSICFSSCWPASDSLNLRTGKADAVLVFLAGRENVSRVWGSEGYIRLKKREAEMGRSFSEDELRHFLGSERLRRRKDALQRGLAQWQEADMRTISERVRSPLPSNASLRATGSSPIACPPSTRGRAPARAAKSACARTRSATHQRVFRRPAPFERCTLGTRRPGYFSPFQRKITRWSRARCRLRSQPR